MALTEDAKQKLIEYQKCKGDLFYFAEHYVKLSQSGADIVPKLYAPQKDFLNALLHKHYVTLLKTRQTGGSTSAQIYTAWAMIFYKNVVVGVVSRKGDEATDFAKKVMNIINNVPDWMKPVFEKQTERTCRLDNGSELFAEAVIASNPGSLFRGKAITIAIIDEAAYINYIDVAYTSFAPALFKAHQVAQQYGIPYCLMVISTPNRTVGIGKWFFDMLVASKEPDSLFVSKTLYWKDIPEFAEDPNWYQTQRKLLNNDEGRIKQELEMEFLGSSDSWLPLTIIDVLNKSHVPPISVIPFQGGELWQWEPLDISRFYLIGVDTASSSGGDKSTIEVFDFENFNQVAEFKGKLQVFDFCNVVKIVHKLYPNNCLVVENNSYGTQVVETLNRSGESYNLYLPKDKVGKSPVVYGLSTNAKTRPLMMDALYTYVTQNPNMIRSERLALELIGLVEIQTSRISRVEADKGAHDDLCLALAFISYVRKYDPPLGVKNERSDSAVQDIEMTLSYNEENLHTPLQQTGNQFTQFTGTKSIGILNQNLMSHIKDTMFKDDLKGHVDVLDILGYNRK